MLRQVSLALEAETDIQEVARSHNATITVLDCKDVDKKDMAFLIDISTRNGDADEVINELKEKKIFKKIYAGAAEERSSKILCLAIRDRPAICQAVADCGAFCLTCPYSGPEADGKWKLLVKDSEQLKALLANLEGREIVASIGGLSGVRRGEDLTSRQMEILAKAISLGYFEFPRRFSLTELSEQIGVKPSTLSQVLRAAEEKVMARYANELKISKISAPQRLLFP
jgi:predicted DNA binding protein